jgi:hypothetical protein
LKGDPGATEGVEDFVRLEAGLVFERGAAGNVVAEIDVGKLGFLGLGDERKDVEGTE